MEVTFFIGSLSRARKGRLLPSADPENSSGPDRDVTGSAGQRRDITSQVGPSGARPPGAGRGGVRSGVTLLPHLGTKRGGVVAACPVPDCPTPAFPQPFRTTAVGSFVSPVLETRGGLPLDFGFCGPCLYPSSPAHSRCSHLGLPSLPKAAKFPSPPSGGGAFLLTLMVSALIPNLKQPLCYLNFIIAPSSFFPQSLNAFWNYCVYATPCHQACREHVNSIGAGKPVPRPHPNPKFDP